MVIHFLQYERIMYIIAFVLCLGEAIAMTAYFSKTGLLYSGIGFLILTSVSMIIGSVILIVLGKIIEKCIYKMPKMVYNKCVRRESHWQKGGEKLE